MLLKKVSLFNFKNHAATELTFSEGINCFVGINGSGKTNLLDAIHYLALTKGATSATDLNGIKHGEELFSIKGVIEKKGSIHELLCAYNPKQKKVFKVDKKEYDKLSEHIGLFPVVLIAPNDTDIIRDSSDVRRKFFDGILSQLDSHYLHLLIRYNHFLKQRNALLKQFAQNNTFDKDLLLPYSNEIIKLSISISQLRQDFMVRYSPIFFSHYQNLSDGREEVTIAYKSKALHPDFEKLFNHSIEKDRITQRTNFGIHKDDFEFIIDGQALKRFGSQGQQKSFLVALKLTQFDIFKEEKGFMPLLLLDDIFDKLDDLRIKKLIEMVGNHKFGQLFITDARPERSKELLKNIHKNTLFFHVENGIVK